MPDIKILSQAGNAPGGMVGFNTTARRGGAVARNNVLTEIRQFFRRCFRKAVSTEPRIVQLRSGAESHGLLVRAAEAAPVRLDALRKVLDARPVALRVQAPPLPPVSSGGGPLPVPGGAAPPLQVPAPQAPGPAMPVLEAPQVPAHGPAENWRSSADQWLKKVTEGGLDRANPAQRHELGQAVLGYLRDVQAHAEPHEDREALIAPAVQALVSLYFPAAGKGLGLAPEAAQAAAGHAVRPYDMPEEAQLDRMICDLDGQLAFVQSHNRKLQSLHAAAPHPPAREPEWAQTLSDIPLETKKNYFTSRYAHHPADWPSPVFAASRQAFMAQLGRDLTALCTSTPEFDGRLLDTLVAASRLSLARAGAAAPDELSLGQALDVLHVFRLNLADLTHLDFERGTMASNGPDQITRTVQALLPDVPEVLAAPGVPGAPGVDRAPQRRALQHVKRLEAHGQAVDRLLGQNHSQAARALALKLRVAETDADRELIHLLHQRQLSLQVLHKTLTLETKASGTGPKKTTPALVGGTTPRFDGHLRALLFSPRVAGQRERQEVLDGSLRMEVPRDRQAVPDASHGVASQPERQAVPELPPSEASQPDQQQVSEVANHAAAGSLVRAALDPKHEAAMKAGSGASQRTLVTGSNAQEFKFLLAHTLRLQQEIDHLSGLQTDSAATQTDRQQLMAVRDWRALGFSNDEIAAMNEDAGIAQALEAAEQMFQMGFNSPEAAQAATQQLDSIRHQVMRSTLALQGLQAVIDTPEAHAKRLLQGFEGQLQAHQVALGPDGFDGHGETLGRAAGLLHASVEASDRRTTLAEAAETARNDIRAYNRAQAPAGRLARLWGRLRGATPPPIHPNSMRTQTLARTALSLQTRALQLPGDSEAALEAAFMHIDHIGLRSDLAGYLSTLARQRDSALGQALHEELRTAFPDWHDPGLSVAQRDQVLLALVKRVHFGPPLQALALSRHVLTLNAKDTQAREADGDMITAEARRRVLLEQRQQAMPEAVASALTQALRAVAAKAWLARPEASRAAPLVLVDHQEEIRATLADWGVTADRFGPEIDDLLTRQIDAEGLKKWQAEGLALSPAPAPVTSLAAAQRDLQDTIASMSVGDRVYLKSGRNLQAGVAKVPVAAASPVTFTVSMSFNTGVNRQFDIKRKKPDLYQVTITHGEAFGATMGAAAKWVAEASLNAQLNHEGTQGQVLEFSTLESAQAFARALMDEAPLTARALLGAQHVRSVAVEEVKLGGDLGVAVGSKDVASLIQGSNPALAATLAPSGALALGAGVQVQASLSLAASAKISGSRTWTHTLESSNKALVTKRSTAFVFRGDAELALKAKLPNLGESAAAALIHDPAQPNPAGAMPVSLLSVAPAAVFAKGYEHEFAFERDPVHGTLLSLDQKYVLPLAAGMTLDAVGQGVSALAPHLARLDPGRRAEINEALQKVDAPEGYVLLALLGGPKERVQQLNDLFEADKALAADARQGGTVKLADERMKAAYQAHADRIAAVDDEASAFELGALVLVRGANMSRERSWGLGVNRMAWTGKGGADAALAFVPAKPVAEAQPLN
jgi:hypothetical protein